MSSDGHRSHGRGRLLVLASVASIGYAWAAAATTPFTWAANAVTAVPIVAVAVLAVVRWPARPDRGPAMTCDGRSPPRHPHLTWLVLLAVIVGWELVEYFWRGSRSAHPTLSSMVDALDAHAIGKAIAFLAWLWLGTAIVRAGTPAGSWSGAAGGGAQQA
jgi:hypothetical protein